MGALKRILVVTGITGGHFFPALCFAEKYHSEYPDSEIFFLLCRQSATFNAAKYLEPFKTQYIPVDPLPKPFSFKMVSFLVNYAKSLMRTFAFVKELKPSVLVSFGSYGSFPAVVTSWLNQVPIVVHEQNKISGWANRASAVFARWVATSFPDTLGNLPQGKVLYIGYPVRPQIRAVLEKSTDERKGKSGWQILVLGGSQGSQVLNHLVLDFFSLLTAEEKERIAVIHITGEKQFDMVKSHYQNLEIRSRVYPFSEEVGNLYQESDLVIARAGAGTIFELAAFGRPAILVPYPYAYAHQSLNAKCLAEADACITFDEGQVNGAKLKEVVIGLFQNRNRYQSVSQNVKRFDVADADKRLVELVQKAAEE